MRDPEKLRRNQKASRDRHRERVRARDRVYAAAHRERNRARSKAWATANAEKYKAYFTDHRDELRVKQKAYRETHRDERREKWKVFYLAARAADIERVRAKTRAHVRKRRAVKRGAVAETVDYMKVIRDANGRCGICKRPFDLFGVHVDHIVPLARGGTHTYDNLQATHAFCNLSKGVKVG